MTFSPFPSPGNSITERDVAKRQLRITKDFKKYFPITNSELIITIDGLSYSSSFIYREGRSHILKLGNEIVKKIKLQAGSQVLIRKYDNVNYELEVRGDD